MITLKLFCQKLATVKEAISSKGKTYTNVKLEDTVITFQREKKQGECIIIEELYNAYLNEASINTTKLRIYLSGKVYSPALAIMKTAGLYDDNGKRIELDYSESSNNRFLIPSRILRPMLFLIHFLPIIAVIIAIFLLSSDNNPFNQANLIVGGVIVIVSISFLIYVYKIKKDNIGENTYTSYFTLLIFSVGIFPFYNYVKDYQKANKVRVAYTTGFRAWGAKVQVYDIIISYYDRYGNPKKADHSKINDIANWKTGYWTVDNDRNHLVLKDTTCFHVQNDSLFITLTNASAILKPDVFENEATSFFVTAKVKYLQADPLYDSLPADEKYSSIQFCLKIPVDLSDNKPNDIYYAHEFFFADYTWSKLRIPGFNFDFDNENLFHRLTNYESAENAKHTLKGINSTIFFKDSTGKNYSLPVNGEAQLSALSFNDNAVFNIYKMNSSHSLPLYKFNLSKYGEFVLESK